MTGQSNFAALRLSYVCSSMAALALVAAGCRGASEYPDRPITLICPWAAGGGTDRVSRHLAVFLEHELGVPVNVVNATGGAGVTGHSRGLHARPDGYTITMMTVELNMLHWRKLTKISWRDGTTARVPTLLTLIGARYRFDSAHRPRWPFHPWNCVARE